jgi:hypothetical protein
MSAIKTQTNKLPTKVYHCETEYPTTAFLDFSFSFTLCGNADDAWSAPPALASGDHLGA